MSIEPSAPPAHTSPAHTTVLLAEAVASILGKLGGTYVDATFGRGGHTALLLQSLDAKARVLALDRDTQAIDSGRASAVAQDARLTLVHAKFSDLAQVLTERHIEHIDGLLLDIGVSSPQLDEAQRGFSFSKDAPLDMRMDQSANSPSQSVRDWLAKATETEIKGVIHEYGEERHAARIAAHLVARRAIEPIATTGQLAQLVERAVPFRQPGHHPATRTFQAFRIHVNQELQELAAVLKQATDCVAIGGKLAVISFHSLEDRLVKQALRPAPITAALRHLPRPEAVHPWRETARIKPSAAECKANPRARSATLRVAVRVGGAP